MFNFFKSTLPASTTPTTTAVPIATAVAVEEIAIPESTNAAIAVVEHIPEEDNKKEGIEIKMVDLVYTFDCTGSMGQYIAQAKSTIMIIAQRLIQQENCDFRFALVAYRDHPPQDSTFITKIFDFTTNLSMIQSCLDSLSASGGGDGPEAVTAALYATEHLAWRPNAAKVVILIADAPPHGLGENGDGFPGGDPDGRDPIVIANSMASKGITIYPVACEPAISSYKNALSFMIGLAKITDGQATSLSSAQLLADVILGGTVEEIGLQTLVNKFEADMSSVRDELSAARGGGTVPDEEVQSVLFARMRTAGVKTMQHKCDGIINDERSNYWVKNASLGMAMKELGTVEPIASNRSAPLASATRSAVEMEDVSYEQVQRIFTKARKQGKY